MAYIFFALCASGWMVVQIPLSDAIIRHKQSRK